MKNIFFDEEVKKNLFKSFQSPLFKPSPEPFFLIKDYGGSPKGIEKTPKMKKKYRPKNIVLRMDQSQNDSPEKEYEITFSGNFVTDNFKIGESGIVKGLTQFQSQSLEDYDMLDKNFFKDKRKETPKSPEEEEIADFGESSISLLFNSQELAPMFPKKVKKKLEFTDLEKVRELGTGASSNVILMRDRNTEQLYANKVINISPSFKPAIITDEIAALYRCRKSDYIVQFFDAFYVKGIEEIHIILENMDANSLRDVFKKCDQVPSKICSIIAHKVLKGLQYLHKKNIVHRDIKPDNILLNRCGDVKISDFGLTGSSKKDYSLRNDLVFKTIKGTVMYMSPERIKEEKYGFNSDLWSLGVTLIEIRSGSFPFPNKGNYFDLLEELESMKTEDLFLSSNLFDKHFQKFIRSCLIIDPQKRPSADELLEYPFVAGCKNMDEGGCEFVKEFLDGYFDD